jgi:hypothetical protein
MFYSSASYTRAGCGLHTPDFICIMVYVTCASDILQYTFLGPWSDDPELYMSKTFMWAWNRSHVGEEVVSKNYSVIVFYGNAEET